MCKKFLTFIFSIGFMLSANLFAMQVTNVSTSSSSSEYETVTIMNTDGSTHTYRRYSQGDWREVGADAREHQLDIIEAPSRESAYQAYQNGVTQGQLQDQQIHTPYTSDMVKPAAHSSQDEQQAPQPLKRKQRLQGVSAYAPDKKKSTFKLGLEYAVWPIDRVFQTVTGTTALIKAIKKGDEFWVTILLASGFDKNKADNDGMTPLHWAAKSGNKAIAEKLLKAGADKDKADEKMARTPLALAARLGHADIVELLLNFGADKDKADECGTTPLLQALSFMRIDIVGMLLDAGADPNIADKINLDETPLHRAALSGHTALAEILLNAGADTDTTDAVGCTPLLLAVESGNTAIVKMLLAAGADPDAINNVGNTPLQMAVSNGHKEIAELLFWITKKSAENLEFSEDTTLAGVLIENGADIDPSQQDDRQADLFDSITETGTQSK